MSRRGDVPENMDGLWKLNATTAPYTSSVSWHSTEESEVVIPYDHTDWPTKYKRYGKATPLVRQGGLRKFGNIHTHTHKRREEGFHGCNSPHDNSTVTCSRIGGISSPPIHYKKKNEEEVFPLKSSNGKMKTDETIKKKKLSIKSGTLVTLYERFQSHLSHASFLLSFFFLVRLLVILRSIIAYSLPILTAMAKTLCLYLTVN